MVNWPSKTVPEFKDYGLDWRPALSKLGDPTIVGSVWTRLSGDVAITAGAIQADLRRTAVKISAGTAGVVSVLRNTITLSIGAPATVLTVDALVRVRA